jgi:oxygen-dependent protoporphyrinogen oxidase
MAPAPSAPLIAVVGAGLTGLSAAYALTQRGLRVKLFEASAHIGGVIQSERSDGWLIERGRTTSALITALGLDSERAIANPAAKKRFIVRDGKLCPIPMSPPALFRTPLFSFRSKWRLFAELFTRPRMRTHDLALAAMIEEHFGPEIVEYALNPFVSGVYAGNPSHLSARHAFPSLWEGEQTHGSLIRAQIAQAKARRKRGDPRAAIISFRNGLQTLTDALGAHLPVETLELRAKVLSLTPGPPWRVTWARAGDTHVGEFSAVISALPAEPLSQLDIGLTANRPLAELADIPHPPIASLFLGFSRSQIAHPLDGFGVLIPAREQRKILGVLFSSSLFAGRAPDDHVALTVLAGGTQRPELIRLGTDELAAELLPELNALLGITGDPVFQRLQLWPRAIPQYNLGHERFTDSIRSCCKLHSGLYIGGQVSDGISLPNCLAAGQKLADGAWEYSKNL